MLCANSKFPHYSEQATTAFQRVSLAYDTLSKPTSRRAYDISGKGGLSSDAINAGTLKQNMQFHKLC